MRWETGGDVGRAGGCTSIRGGGAGVAGPPAPIPFAFAGGALGAKEPAGLIDDARQRLQWLQCRVDRVGHVGAAGGGGHQWDIGVRWSPNVPSVALRWPQTPLFLGTTITTSTPSIHPSIQHGVTHMWCQGTIWGWPLYGEGTPNGTWGSGGPKCPLCGTQVTPNPIIFGYNHHNINAIH